MRCWEEVLGQRVLFVEEADGRWRWQAGDLDVRHDPAVRFPTLSAARLACAAMVYAFFVMEEVTGVDVPSSIKPSSSCPEGGGLGSSSPPQGSGGGN